MAQSCTLFCKLGKQDVVTIMSKHFDELAFNGGPEDWTAVSVDGEGGSMTLNALTFQYTNDEYSNLHFRTCMFLWDLETLSDDEKANLNDAFGIKTLIIGVVAEPDFSTDERFMGAVLEIAKTLDGLIITGDSILDSAGSTLAVFS